MKRPIPHLLAVALVSILAAACTPGGGSIYYTLENEVKLDDATLPNDITVFDIVNTGTDYYAAAGRIWKAPVVAANFQVANVVAQPHADDLCTALAFFGGELYGGFVNSSGNRGLYGTTALAFSTTPVADADVLGAQVVLLKVEDGQLVVVTARPSGSDFEYTVYTSADGASYTEFPGLSARAAADKLVPINDVIWSNSLSAWFMTEGKTLYTDLASPGTLQASTMNGTPVTEVLTGLYDDGTTVYLASREGAVYWWDPAAIPSATWKRIAAPTASGAHPPLTRFAGPVGTGILLLGSDGYGYYRIDTTDLAAGTAAITRFPTTTIDLHTASVTKLTLDTTPDPDVIFAGTAMGGLWRGTVAVDGTIAWELE